MPRLFEYYHPPVGEFNQSVYTADWEAQTFTTGPLPHSITSVKIYLQRLGAPGTLTLGIRATDSAGKPTGSDLTSGTMDSSLIIATTGVGAYNGKLYEIPVTEYLLRANTLYAIVLRTAGGDGVNYILWTFGQAGGGRVYPMYLYGKAWASADLGVTWGLPVLDRDYWFEVWGNDAKTEVSETTSQPSTSSTVVSSDGARVRTVSHTTILTPWTA